MVTIRLSILILFALSFLRSVAQEAPVNRISCISTENWSKLPSHHLVEHIVLTGEVTKLFDVFGQQRIKEKKYTAGEIHSKMDGCY